MLTQLLEQRSPSISCRTQPLWNDARSATRSLGCGSCIDKATCGGLSVASALYDCLDFCCHTPADCDSVCRNNPGTFANRVREIRGFSLENVPRAIPTISPELPSGVPVIFHGNKRSNSFIGPGTVCLPLYKLVDLKSRQIKYASSQALTEKFGLHPATQVILTGTSTDPALERWWVLGESRIDLIHALKRLNIALVTTPNYSLFTDQPRWDDLHSMKRIALVHQEFLREGMPAALHINARTEWDWERWRDFVAGREEVTHLAFEFATGAGWGERINWYAEQLSRLACAVDRPLHLIVRGGTTILPRLAACFGSLTCLETSTFLKTMRRKAAVLRADGSLRWRHAPTNRSEPLDTLLKENWNTVANVYDAFTPALRKAA